MRVLVVLVLVTLGCGEDDDGARWLQRCSLDAGPPGECYPGLICAPLSGGEQTYCLPAPCRADWPAPWLCCGDYYAGGLVTASSPAVVGGCGAGKETSIAQECSQRGGSSAKLVCVVPVDGAVCCSR